MELLELQRHAIVNWYLSFFFSQDLWPKANTGCRMHLTRQPKFNFGLSSSYSQNLLKLVIADVICGLVVILTSENDTQDTVLKGTASRIHFRFYFQIMSLDNLFKLLFTTCLTDCNDVYSNVTHFSENLSLIKRLVTSCNKT